jgi:hypothetical protein
MNTSESIMKSTNQVFPIDSLLPDTLIQRDLIEILWKEKDEIEIELDEESPHENVIVKKGEILQIISKCYRRNFQRIGFGDSYYYAQIAIGGVKDITGGVVYPVHCFATLFYTNSCKLITVDFHDDLR